MKYGLPKHMESDIIAQADLSSICEYRKGKVSISSLDETTYISTENMLPNKGGITAATALPKISQTQAYFKGDILVSNIRPYFKKIWQASFDGGCSNDVLVFQAKDEVDPDFLYYVLSDNSFFDYATATSKGTKMPRGDRVSIMHYQIPLFPTITQRKIAEILGVLDEKIAINRQINNNLLQQATAIYHAWFEEYIPFNRSLPANWAYVTLGEIANISSGKRPLMKSAVQTEQATIPLVGASSVMGFTNKANHEDKILVMGRVGTHGIIQRFDIPCWASDNTLVITSKYYEYIYQVLQRIDYSTLNRGSTQPLITQGDVNKVSVLKPDKPVLLEFENIVGTLMLQYEANRIQNRMLSELRDTLLPRLMSGEVDMSGFDL